MPQTSWQQLFNTVTNIFNKLPSLVDGKMLIDSTDLTAINTKLPTAVSYAETQLTATGTTTSRQTDTALFTYACIGITVANINTSVTVRAEGSLDNTNWFNLDINDTDTTYTANGTYSLFTNIYFKYIRLNFVSESGGTTATIDAVVYLR